MAAKIIWAVLYLLYVSAVVVFGSSAYLSILAELPGETAFNLCIVAGALFSMFVNWRYLRG